MSANLTEIGNIIVPVARADPARAGLGTFHYIDIACVDRVSKSITEAPKLSVSEAPSRARQLLKAGDVLVSTVRPNLNAVAIIPAHLNGAVGSTGFCVLRADTLRVLPRYLYYYVQSKAFVAHLSRIAIGASYPAVSDDD